MFHKEGHTIIIAALLTASAISLALHFSPLIWWIKMPLQLLVLVLLAGILFFFRNPKRTFIIDDSCVRAPADGKIVIIKEVFESEYYKDNRLLVSIFMSPLNLHVTRYPISGRVVYSKYHPGRYLVAWHPKSSEKNERTTIVLENEVYGRVLYRQIAGAVARRIVNYAQEDARVVQGADAGFIKFGSRIDIYLPLTASVKVTLHQRVRGGIDTIAQLTTL